MENYVEKNNQYVSVPNILIYKGNDYELATFVALSLSKLYIDKSIAAMSVVSLCKKMGYSYTDRRKDSFFSSIKKIITQFEKNGWVSNCPTKFAPSQFYEIKLNSFFFPDSEFTLLSLQELETILECKEYKSKTALVKTFLYIKSFMNITYNGNPDSIISAFYVAGTVASHTLGMSRGKYDFCVNILCWLGLLICRQTGSYYDETGIKNAPNIYVLNDDRAEDNIRGAMSRLRYKLLNPQYGNKDDFMPIVYIGKTIKKDKTESEFEDHIQDDEEDNGEWGDRNPMERNYYNYY